jgi:hypothetical protein
MGHATGRPTGIYQCTTRHRNVKRLSLVVIIGFVALLPACGSYPATGQAAQIRPAARSTPRPIMINSSTGETFAPASSETPAVTAAQAWAAFAHGGSNQLSKAIPAGTTVQLGLVTLPVGPADAPGAARLTHSDGEAYTALKELAWGFSWKQCGPVVVPVRLPGSSPAPVPKPSDCTEWLFLDAKNGKQIDLTWQQKQ